jgi:hypothetical protein
LRTDSAEKETKKQLKMTKLYTTSIVTNHKDRIQVILKLAKHIEDKLVELTSNSGIHKYICLNGKWETYLFESN